MDSTVKNILFMIDTSASMSEREVAQAYSEIKGTIVINSRPARKE